MPYGAAEGKEPFFFLFFSFFLLALFLVKLLGSGNTLLPRMTEVPFIFGCSAVVLKLQYKQRAPFFSKLEQSGNFVTNFEMFVKGS